MSLEDMNALLNSGNLVEALGGAEEVATESKPESVKKRKGQAGAARGRRRTLSTEEKEKRRR